MFLSISKKIGDLTFGITLVSTSHAHANTQTHTHDTLLKEYVLCCKWFSS